MRAWIMEDGAPVSLAVVPLPHDPCGLRSAAARLRRGMRDVRDRMARRDASWRAVAVAGMATGDGRAFVLVRHPAVERPEIANVLRRRWPDCIVGDAAAAEPSWRLATEDAADLARARRSVEPLRIVIPAQRTADQGVKDRAGTRGTPTHFALLPIVV